MSIIYVSIDTLFSKIDGADNNAIMAAFGNYTLIVITHL